MASLSELEQLQEPLRHLAAQSRNKHARIEEQKRELQQASKEEIAINEKYRKYLIYYARRDCLQLANMMHQSLPEELRELIYEYLCVEPDRPIPVGPYYHFRKYDKPLGNPTDDFTGNGPRTMFVPPRRPVDISSYAAHAGNNAVDDVEMGEASRTEDVYSGSGRPGDSWGTDASNVSMNHDLTERIDQLRVENDIEDSNMDDVTIVLPDGRVKEDHSHKPPSDMVLPSSHFLNPRYVGPAISYEIQKMYYTRNTFSICNVEEGIFNFLHQHSGYSMQRWRDGRPPNVPEDLKLQPLFFPKKYIQNLQIRIKFEQFHSDMPENLTDNEAYAYEREFLRFTLSNLDGLKVLWHGRPKLGLNIEFIIMTALPNLESGELGTEAQCNFINFLQVVRHTVYTMLHDCVDVSIKITHHDEGLSPFPRNITGIFALTKEQWEQEKSVHKGRREWMTGFYLAPPAMDPDTLTFGFSGREMDGVLRERWGINSVRDTNARYPVQEGKYWPRGNE